MADKTVKEPLIKITRNISISNKKIWLIRIIGILAGFVACALVSTILKPGTFFDFFKQLGIGSFETPKRIVSFLEEMALLLVISLALLPAFRMKFWNIGAEGQVLMGALGCYVIMRYMGKTAPTAVLWITMIAASLGAGILWAVIPAIFKAAFNTNETLFTLMMNYIAKGLIVYLICIWAPTGSGSLTPISPEGNIPGIEIGGVTYNYIINIIVVAVVFVLIFIYFKYTKHGYEVDVVGGSQNTARYIGINVKKVIIRTMVLSGAICGLAGFLITAGASHTISAEVAGGRGFTAVLIAWLSNLNPLEMILSSGLVAFVTKGCNQACSIYFQNGSNYTDIMIGLFFFVIIAFTFFSKYKLSFPRYQNKKLTLESSETTKQINEDQDVIKNNNNEVTSTAIITKIKKVFTERKGK